MELNLFRLIFQSNLLWFWTLAFIFRQVAGNEKWLMPYWVAIIYTIIALVFSIYRALEIHKKYIITKKNERIGKWNTTLVALFNEHDPNGIS